MIDQSRQILSLRAADSYNAGRGYHLTSGFSPTRNNNAEEVEEVLAPVDRANGVYVGLVLAGVGFLLPYNRLLLHKSRL
jgi:hypothetical protein